MKMTTMALLFSALALSACNTTTEAEYQLGQAALKNDAEIRRAVLADCRKDVSRESATDRANMAALMNVSVAKVPATFCNRVIKAVANGRISYADVTNAGRSGNYAEFISILQGR